MTELAIVECQRCGKAWWSDLANGPIDGGPCCFGHEVLDIERHSERAARKAWPAWAERRKRALQIAWREHRREVEHG